MGDFLARGDEFHSLKAIAQMPDGNNMATPVPIATARGETPWSIDWPAVQVAAAKSSIEIARSAPNTLPRKRSSTFKCNSVVENTQTVDVPQCARIITANAHQMLGAFPSRR